MIIVGGLLDLIRIFSELFFLVDGRTFLSGHFRFLLGKRKERFALF